MTERGRVARAIWLAVDTKREMDWSDAVVLERMADAALAAMDDRVVPQPDWEGFGRDMMEQWPVGDVDGSDLFDAALRNGLIRDIPGGFDPERHIDTECTDIGAGDPWYEYAFRPLPAPLEADE